ncbi:MAG: hypothetical protein ABIS21_07035, partial [Acidimicrobiales bacterium]
MTVIDFVVAADLAPLRRRLALLQILRFGLALAVSATALIVPHSLGGRPVSSLIAVSLAYGGAAGAVEWYRRRSGLLRTAVVSGLILLDGVYLAVVMSLTGG